MKTNINQTKLTMLYRLDKQRLVYKKVKHLPIFLKSIIGSIVFIMLLSVSTSETPREIEYESVLIVEDERRFTEDKLIHGISKMNFRFPHIVLAQAMHETHHFKSDIFMENHNLFGMKEASVRLNMAKGTSRGHAYYNHWEESLIDYSLWYSTYASKCRTEDQLYSLLGQVYAEDTLYVPKLKHMIQRYNLKGLF